MHKQPGSLLSLQEGRLTATQTLKSFARCSPQKEPITFIFLFVFCPQLLKGDFCSSGAEMLVVHKISHNFPSQQKKQFDTVSRIFLPIIAIQEETSESDDDSLVQITRKVNFVSNP